jgi:ubiquinone/menaquinone biosynthesis C-methylase UbiE
LKIPFYKRLLSYVVEIPVEERYSDLSGSLELSIHQGEWKLSSPNAVYSFGMHYTSYRIAFDRLGIFDFPAKRVLMLGAGIGSIARLLAGHPSTQEMVVVDIDPVVIQFAKEYWPYEMDVKVEFHADDAAQFAERIQQGTFDLILSDVFVDDVTPDQINTDEYLQNLQKLLSPEGMLLFSKLDYKPSDHTENKDFSAVFQSVFPQGFTLKAAHNLMFVGRK